MSDMYDVDELVDLIPRDVSASPGYKTADELARDLWRLAQKCPECCANYQANYLENGDDMLTIPDGYVMPNEEVSGRERPYANGPLDRRVMR